MNDITTEIRKLRGPIVVFGGCGFLGANMFRKILSVREDCYAITHRPYVPWRLVGLDQTKILRCDVTRKEQVERLFRDYNFPTILYFAAYGAYSRQANAELIYETNVLGLLHVTEAAAGYGFSALVHAGTSSEYGLNCEAPREDAALQPNSHYAVSKASIAYLIQFLGKIKSQPVINLRFYSVYGPWEEPDRLIPTLVENGLEKKYPPLVDPEISRDFVYVDDGLEAMVLAATRGVERLPGGSVNIATGRATTLRDVADLAKELFQIEGTPQWSSMPNRAWDLRKWFGNPQLAQDVLGWSAKTPLREGLQQTIDWFKANRPALQIRPSVSLAEPVRLSAVIACYKDGQAIPYMYKRLVDIFQSLKVDYEIIFVNDASPDNSDQVLEEICRKDEHVIAVEHSRNFGSQGAFLSGMAISTGDAVVLLDGDLQDPPELIAPFFERWEKGFEVIYGSRERRVATPVQNFFYKLFYRLFRFLAYIPIPVDAGDFSLMDRKVVNELLALPETDQFLRGLRAWVGFKQTSVPYTRPERMFGKSTNNWRRNIWWARKGIFSFSFVPLDWLIYGGTTLTILSFLGVAAQIYYRLLHPYAPRGFSTVIVLIFFFSGLQLLAISVLGEYLSKTLEETKRRPKYIRKAVRFGGRHFQRSQDIEKFVNSRAPLELHNS